jgi:hypothetical protein
MKNLEDAKINFYVEKNFNFGDNVNLSINGIYIWSEKRSKEEKELFSIFENKIKDYFNIRRLPNWRLMEIYYGIKDAKNIEHYLGREL